MQQLDLVNGEEAIALAALQQLVNKDVLNRWQTEAEIKV